MALLVQHAARDEAGLDVAAHGEPREKIRILEDEAALGARAGDRLRCRPSSSPESGESRPAMRRSSVDLPQPLGPTRETSSPAATESETLSSACVRTSASSGVGKVLLTSTTRSDEPSRDGAGGRGYHLITPFCQTSTRSRTLKSSGHDGGEERGHDDERGVDLAVFRPALRPADIPAEAGFHADGFGDDEREERRAQAHEQADEDVRHRGGNGDAEDEIRPARAERARDIEVGGARVGNAGGGQHRDRKPDGERDQADGGERAGSARRPSRAESRRWRESGRRLSSTGIPQ